MPPTTRRRNGADTGPRTIPERMTYVFTDDYLDVLAGDDPRLRNLATGAPSPTKICIAARLDRTTLNQIERGIASLTATTQGSFVALLESRGYSEDTARKALFRRVTVTEAAARSRRTVAA